MSNEQTPENLIKSLFRPLKWYTPEDHPQDDLYSLCMAHGIGGRYSIQEDLDKFVVWMANDEFTFLKADTVEECKEIAEEHFYKSLSKLLKSPKERGEVNCWVPQKLQEENPTAFSISKKKYEDKHPQEK